MKKKILVIIPEDFSNGGIQSVVINSVRLLKDYYDFDLITFSMDSQNDRYYNEFLSYGGRVINFKPYNGSNHFFSSLEYYFKFFKYGRRIRAIMRNGYDVVHCHLDFFSGFVLKKAYKEGINKRIAHFHTNTKSETSFIRKFFYGIGKKYIDRYANLVLGCSGKTIDYDFQIEKKVINNPYDDTRFYRRSDELISNSLSLVQVGALSFNKNQLFSIKVVSELSKKYPDVHFTIIGFELDEGYLQLIKNLISEKKLDKSIDILGGNTDIPKYLEKANYLLLPSYAEGFGIVLVEAQSMGLQCFVSSSVPNDANMGGCVYLDLEQGPGYWADRIISHYRKQGRVHLDCDCSAYSYMRVREQYLSVYQ